MCVDSPWQEQVGKHQIMNAFGLRLAARYLASTVTDPNSKTFEDSS